MGCIRQEPFCERGCNGEFGVEVAVTMAVL